MLGRGTCLEDNCSKYSKNSEGDHASTYGHPYFISCVIFLGTAAGSFYFIYGLIFLENCPDFDLTIILYAQVAGRALGELVRKLGERVLPSIIPILSQGLKDPNASRRQVSILSLIFLQSGLKFAI